LTKFEINEIVGHTPKRDDKLINILKLLGKNELAKIR